MNCSRFETVLSDYMEGLLDAPVREAAAKHVSECTQCSGLVEEVRSIRGKLENFPVLEVPAGLNERVLDLTTGRPHNRSFWRDLILPTLRPFMTQRYAFATLILFVFLSLMVNLVGPPAGAEPSPSLGERADQVTSEISKKWAQIQDYRTLFVEEVKLLKDDLFGRLDYHLVTILFSSYTEPTAEQSPSEPANSSEDQPDGATVPEDGR